MILKWFCRLTRFMKNCYETYMAFFGHVFQYMSFTWCFRASTYQMSHLRWRVHKLNLT